MKGGDPGAFCHGKCLKLDPLKGHFLRSLDRRVVNREGFFKALKYVVNDNILHLIEIGKNAGYDISCFLNFLNYILSVFLNRNRNDHLFRIV